MQLRMIYHYWYVPPAIAALLSESRIERLEDACERPLDSVLVCSRMPDVEGMAI